MTNPKQARTRRVVNEQQSDRDIIARRLRLLGASAEEIAAALASWEDLDDDWTEQARHAFAHTSDKRLREGLDAIRAEYPYEEERRGTLIEGAPDAVAMGAFARDEQPLPQLPEGAPSINSTIAVLEEWVGAIAERAALVAEAEKLDAQMRGETPRKTLLAKMEAVVDG